MNRFCSNHVRRRRKERRKVEEKKKKEEKKKIDRERERATREG